MGFLTINGYSVPVAGEPKMSEERVGERKDAYNGAPLFSINNYRTEIEGETAPLTKENADGVIGVINGRGQVWSLDNTLWSFKGVGAGFTRDTPACTIVGTCVSSGSPRYDVGANDLHFPGDNAIWCETSTTNVFHENQATCTSSSGGKFNAQYGAVLTVTTATYYQGSKCINVLASCADSGLQIFVPTTQSSGTYTFSTYLKSGSLGEQTQVYLLMYDSSGVIESSTKIICTDEWRRYELTADWVSATQYCYVRSAVSASCADFYVDCIQLE